MLAEIAERFWQKVDKTPGHGPNGDCWVWTSTINSQGYGHFKVDGGQRGTHRVAWELANGASPGDGFVCHRCDNRACVNPAHLFLGTHEENMADMARKGNKKGSRNAAARLTEQDVRRVRILLAAGMTQRSVAEMFGVSAGAISDIATGRNWAHVC
jgi:hypothetical protein